MEYKYTVDACDIRLSKKKTLVAYRELRSTCLEYIRGPLNYPIFHQLSKLAWYTAVFQMLNEARRLEPNSTINEPVWTLITEGYASLVSLGIRKMIDKDRRAISLAWVINKLHKNNHLLTREMYICYDGLPYDYEKSQKHFELSHSNEVEGVSFLPSSGPNGYLRSAQMHKEFDKLAEFPLNKQREDRISPQILYMLEDRLQHPAISKVLTMTDKVVAHTEKLHPGQIEIIVPTYEEVTIALEILVKVANFISTKIFYDMDIINVVPVHQEDPLKNMDQPFIDPKNISNLRYYWENLCSSINDWSSDTYESLTRNSVERKQK